MKIITGDTVILHCSATTADPKIDVDTIRRWHVKGRGWSDIGYHFVILTDGRIQRGRPLNRNGAHTKGHNENIGVCYVGGVATDGKPKDTMTALQVDSFERLVKWLRLITGKRYDIKGHNDYTNLKACPSFAVDVKFKHML